jgi:lambda family phage portal protein
MSAVNLTPQGFTPGFEAAGRGRRLASFPSMRQHVNGLIASTGSTLIARARYMARNDGYASSALESFTGHAVGTGITPSINIADQDLRSAIQTAFKQWVKQCDADGLSDFYGLQKRAVDEFFIVGESLMRYRPRRPQDGLAVPLQIQLIGAEQLPLERSFITADGSRVRAGIEFNQIGQRAAYHFWKYHPFDATEIGVTNTYTRVDAANIVHLFEPKEAGQIRGVPRMARALVNLWLLNTYDDAMLETQRMAAMLTGFITKKSEDDDGPLPPSDTLAGYGSAVQAGAQGDGDGPPAILAPGGMNVLLDGEDISFSTPPSAPNGYDQFQYRQLTRTAAGLSVPYFAMTGDVSKANYSSLRAAIVNYKRVIEQVQHLVIIPRVCDPVFARFLDDAVIAGAIPGLGLNYYAMHRDEILANVTWKTPRWDWVDPMKDAQAMKLMVDAGWIARSDVIEELGEDPIATDNKIAADRDRAKSLGLEFSLTAAKPKPGDTAMQPDPETSGDIQPDPNDTPQSDAAEKTDD